MSGFDYFKESYTTNYANIKGRARRSEYWFTFLFFMIGIFACGMVLPWISQTLYFIVVGIFILGSIIPLFTLRVRRMHDTGNSGWFLLIPIYNFILSVTDSQPGTNKYGPNPTETNSEVENESLINNIGN